MPDPEQDPAEALQEEYYILCPTRPPGQESLISHLISVDICTQRQSENFHKCPTCVRSRLWRGMHPEGQAATSEAAGKA